MAKKRTTKITRENPEWTRQTFAKARAAKSVLPALVGVQSAEQLLRPRGRPKIENPKVAVSLRLPPLTLAKWRATGPGWQTRMALALERAAKAFKY